MTKYIVLITPQGEGAQGEATVHVETAPPTPRITEMTIRSVAADGAPMLLPSIDLEGVVRALSAGIRGIAAPGPGEDQGTTPVAAAIATSAAEPAPTPAGGKSRQAAAQRTRTPAGKTDAAERGASDRPYRHMPAVDELKAAYEKVGTVTGVAEQYGVPRHTAQGWMARLRKLAN